MKKWLRKTVSLALCAVLLGSAAAIMPDITAKTVISANAADHQTYISGDYEYSINSDDTANIVLYITGLGGDITIPSSLDGRPVTSIGDSAFKNCSGITGVNIPETVTSIGHSSFLGCISLKSITIPKSVKTIGLYAFHDCSDLTSVNLQTGLTVISEEAFSGCVSLTAITFPDGLTTIGNAAFSGCSNLKNITIPKSVTDISRTSFEGTPWLASKTQIFVIAGDNVLIRFNGSEKDRYEAYDLTLPNSIKHIGRSLFREDRFIRSVKIPSSVADIGGSAFYGCTGMTSVTIPQGVKTIGSSAFYECKNLKEISLPDSLKTIGTSAFCACSGLTSITIPKNVKEIGARTFTWCSSLVKVTLPEGLTSIGNNAFNNCQKLKAINMPDSLKTIGINAFYCCASLDNIVIMPEVTSVGDYAFSKCSSLTRIIVIPSNASFGKEALGGTYSKDTPSDPLHDSDSRVIYGKNDSTAKQYADAYGLDFVEYVPQVNSVALNYTQLTVGVGEGIKLNATVNPSYADDKTIKWRTSDSKVLTVDQDGNVKAVGNGIAWITARSNNGYEKSCKFTVKNAPTKVSLSKGTLTIGVGENYTISGGVDNGAAAAIRTYRTSNNSIVKMVRTNWTGEFRGVKVGVAYVTVRLYNGLEKSCKVTVKATPSKITISKGILTIGVGEKYSLSSYVNDGAGCATRTYRTSAPSVVKMTKTDWTGEFIGVKPGIAYVTVRSYNGKESSCKVTVKAAPTSVKVNRSVMTLKVGQTASLSAVIPDNSGCATRTFRTSNSGVVQMTSTNWTGKFKAVKPGIAYVTVRTYNGKESSCRVTVVK